MSPQQRSEAYQQARTDFLETRHLDEDENYWEQEDHRAWHEVLLNLVASGVMTAPVTDFQGGRPLQLT